MEVTGNHLRLRERPATQHECYAVTSRLDVKERGAEAPLWLGH